MSASVPDKPALEGLEEKWARHWETSGTYLFDRTKTRDEIYSIDTPPPTVSGGLHPGHCCSYTHTDITARFWRMRGKEVFYPMGWDDNGLNTERRVQLLRHITCDPSLPLEENFVAPTEKPERPIAVSRPTFVANCAEVTVELEQQYEALWKKLGFSVDWTQTYTTIGEKSRRMSQRGFLRLLEQGRIYRAEAPTMWDVDFQTAVAQAEIEDRERPGAYHKLAFHKPDGTDVIIETTRPELLAACVALVAHPDDERYKPLFDTTVRTPLFGMDVPIRPHRLADPEKGSGIAMICTFGDSTDVIWWRELGLNVRGIIGRNGRMLPVEFGSEGWESADNAAAQAVYNEIEGRNLKQAQRIIVEKLQESGELLDEPRPIQHPVKFWENGSSPLEIVTTKQWFIKFPPKDEMLARAREIEWHPEYMRVRYDDWVNGLQGDWNITRQRYFGVPFPAWYALDAEGDVIPEQIYLADESRLPVDPTTDCPDGFDNSQREVPGGFVADPDVMDTWATSSISPQIVGGWVDDDDLFQRVFPMDLRPQAHEIIRTWLFYTTVRAHYEFDASPWKHAAISGFVTDPDRKKLSKSAGNSKDEPNALIDEYGADAVRYWAGGGRPGRDVELDRNQFKIGRRLSMKVLNASRFVLGFGEVDDDAAVGEPVDVALLAALSKAVDEATKAFESYDYTKARDAAEAFFWSFCDDYLELVKTRAYGDDGATVSAATASARRTLRLALSVQLRLFAPFLSFVTEEVWSWWQEGSVHRAAWPTVDELVAVGAGSDAVGLHAATNVLSQIRRAKTEAKVGMKAAIAKVTVRDTPEVVAAIDAARNDLMSAGVVTELDVAVGDPSITVALAPIPE